MSMKTKAFLHHVPITMTHVLPDGKDGRERASIRVALKHDGVQDGQDEIHKGRVYGSFVLSAGNGIESRVHDEPSADGKPLGSGLDRRITIFLGDNDVEYDLHINNKEDGFPVMKVTAGELASRFIPNFDARYEVAVQETMKERAAAAVAKAEAERNAVKASFDQAVDDYRSSNVLDKMCFAVRDAGLNIQKKYYERKASKEADERYERAIEQGDIYAYKSFNDPKALGKDFDKWNESEKPSYQDRLDSVNKKLDFIDRVKTAAKDSDYELIQ